MKKNILLLLLFGTVLFGCADFLDESPSKDGNNYIATVEDLDNMLQNSEPLYKGAIWKDVITASDDFGMGADPRRFYRDRRIGVGTHRRYIWDELIFDRFSGSRTSFHGVSERLLPFNAILENIDLVDGDNKMLKKQVEAEARFYRAFYHFFGLVAHCQHPKLNNGENLGIPYRDNTSPLNVPSSRGTVKQTMNRIYEDLSDAETLFLEVGRKTFNVKENFRISLTNLKAFEARLRLYDGDYEGADKAAKLALTGYSTINNLNDTKYDFNYGNRYYVYKYVDDDPTKAKLDSLPILLSNIFTTEAGDGLNGHLFEDTEYYISHASGSGTNFLPVSDELYDLYEKADLRKKIHLTNNLNLVWMGKLFNDAPYTKRFSSYIDYSSSKVSFNIGISVPEVMLIRAECASRGFGDGNAQQLLKELRSKRFPDTYTDMIGGTTADVLAERRREMPLVVRWYDLKRLNAVENAGITVTRNVPIDGNITGIGMLKEYSLIPNADFYALPIPVSQLNLLGWEQNPYGGVIEK